MVLEGESFHMKAIVIAIDKEEKLFPLTKRETTLSLPIVNRPALEYMINFLSRFGVNEIAVVGNIGGSVETQNFGNGKNNDLKLHFWNKGLSESDGDFFLLVRDFIDSEPFILTKGNLFLDFNLAKFIDFHLSKNSMLTLGVRSLNGDQEIAENVSLDANNQVNSIHCVSKAFDRRKALVPVGIYILNREILQSLNGDRNNIFASDRLLLELDYSSYPSYAFEINGYCRILRNIADYIEINRDVLLGYVDNRHILKDEIGDGVWIDKSVRIGANVNFFGPIIIGEGSVIEDGAQIVGPAVIGKDCHIGNFSFIRESIIWSNSRIKSDAKVIESIIGSNSTVSKSEYLGSKIRIGSESFSNRDLRIQVKDFTIDNVLVSNSVVASSLGYGFIKRCLDISIAK